MASRGGANLLRARSQFDDKISGPLDKLRDKFDTLGKSKGAKSILQGVGIGAGVAAFGLLKNAIGGVGDALTDSIAKAREEQVGIARLDQALASNISAWDGNRSAIEAVIAEREKLAFSDGEQRDSLALLVARTKDVTKALDLQRLAMDLARLRGMDLATASEIIGKVSSGNVAILTRYGIAVKKGSTATEALAQIQSAAAGQAEKFGDTAEGAAQAAQIALENLQEEIGEELLPVVRELSLWARDEGVPALRDLVETVGNVAAGVGFVGDRVHWFVAEGLTPWDGATVDATHSMREFRRGIYDVARTMPVLAAASGDTKDEIVKDNRQLKRSYEDVTSYLLGEYNDEFDRAMGIREARQDLHEAETNADRAQAYADLAKYGALSQSDYAQWAATLQKMADGTSGKVRQALLEALTDLRALRAEAGKPINVTVAYRPVGSGSAGLQPRAEGGPVLPGRSYTVGERGTETLVMGQSGGYVIPHRGGSGSGGGAPVTIQLQLDGRVVAEVVDRQLYYKSARAPQSRYAG